MIMSVSTLRMGSGAATPVSFVNFCIGSSFGAGSCAQTVGQRPEITFGGDEPVGMGSHPNGGQALPEAPGRKLFEPPFNAS
jgi:hypothetical protein